MTLPPLPQPSMYSPFDGTVRYTAEQMRERDRAIVELCAQTAEKLTAQSRRIGGWMNNEPMKPRGIAAALRSLLTKEEK